MTHIEHESEPWNPASPMQVTLIDSAREVLRSSLGTSWPFFVVLLLVILLTPTIAFFIAGEIKFEPALFVTEWLHLCIEGIFFFFILEIVRHRSLSFAAHRSLVRFVTLNYEKPAQVIIESLNLFRGALDGDQSIDRRKLLELASANWEVMSRALSDDALRHLPGTASLDVWLMRNALRLERCKALIGSILTVRNIHELVASEYEELLRALQEFVRSSRRLHCKEPEPEKNHESLKTQRSELLRIQQKLQ